MQSQIPVTAGRRAIHLFLAESVVSFPAGEIQQPSWRGTGFDWTLFSYAFDSWARASCFRKAMALGKWEAVTRGIRWSFWGGRQRALARDQTRNVTDSTAEMHPCGHLPGLGTACEKKAMRCNVPDFLLLPAPVGRRVTTPECHPIFGASSLTKGEGRTSFFGSQGTASEIDFHLQ